jgi:predicted thioesterase
MIEDIKIGDTFTSKMVVDEKSSTTRGEYQIFSTPDLVLFIELTAISHLNQFISDDQSSVGTKIEVAHQAATLLGQEVIAKVTVSEVDRRRVQFIVEVSDKIDTVAVGTHERFIIDIKKFTDRLGEKRALVDKL